MLALPVCNRMAPETGSEVVTWLWKVLDTGESRASSPSFLWRSQCTFRKYESDPCVTVFFFFLMTISLEVCIKYFVMLFHWTCLVFITGLIADVTSHVHFLSKNGFPVHLRRSRWVLGNLSFAASFNKQTLDWGKLMLSGIIFIFNQLSQWVGRNCLWNPVCTRWEPCVSIPHLFCYAYTYSGSIHYHLAYLIRMECTLQKMTHV